MRADTRLFWSVFATAQYLDENVTVRERIDTCVDLIGKFPLIGIRLMIPGKHRRRFVCEGFRIIYDLRETRFADLNRETPVSVEEALPERGEITIVRFKRV